MLGDLIVRGHATLYDVRYPIAAVIHNLFFQFHISPFPNLEIRINSTIPVASGLGSSNTLDFDKPI